MKKLIGSMLVVVGLMAFPRLGCGEYQHRFSI